MVDSSRLGAHKTSIALLQKAKAPTTPVAAPVELTVNGNLLDEAMGED